MGCHGGARMVVHAATSRQGCSQTPSRSSARTMAWGRLQQHSWLVTLWVAAVVLGVLAPGARAVTETLLMADTAGITNAMVAAFDTTYYNFTITNATLCFVVILTASSGNPDLYLGYDAGVPTTLAFSANNRSDSITIAPSDGFYSTMPQVFHVRVFGNCTGTSTYALSVVTMPTLTMAATVSGSVASGSYQNYFILIDSCQDFTVSVTLLTGDPDLYLSIDGPPAYTIYLSSAHVGSDSLAVGAPITAPLRLFIRVGGYTASTYNLRVAYAALPTLTNTPSATPTSSRTPSNTPTSSRTPSKTGTSSITPSRTGTPSRTPSTTTSGSPTCTSSKGSSRTPTSSPSPTGTQTRTPSTSPASLVLRFLNFTELPTSQLGNNDALPTVRITLTGAGFTNYDRSLDGVSLTTDAPGVVLRNISSVAAQALSCEVDAVTAYWRQFTFILSMSAQTATITKPYRAPPSGVTVSPRGAISYGTAVTLNATGIGNGTIAAVTLRLPANATTSGEPATYPCAIDASRTARDVLTCTPWELQDAAFSARGLTLLVQSNDTPAVWFAPALSTNITIIRPALTLASRVETLSVNAAGSRTLVLLSVPGPPPLQGTRLQRMWNVTSTTTCCGPNNGTTSAPRIPYTPLASGILGCRVPTAAAADGATYQLHASLGPPNASSSMALGPPATTALAVAPPTVWHLFTTSSVMGYDALTQNVTLGGVVTLVGRRLASATGNARVTAMSVGGHDCTTLAVNVAGTMATCSWSTEVPVAELADVDVWRGNVTADWAGGWISLPVPAGPAAVAPAAAMSAVRLRPAMAALVPSVVSGGTTLVVAGVGLGSRGADHVSLTVGGAECANPIVVSADVVTCTVPDLIGVNNATVEGSIIADLPATAPGNVSFSTALLPEWADTPPGSDTVVMLLPGGRAAGATAPWPSPAPALYIRGVGSGSCQLLLSNVSTGGVAYPSYGSGLGLPPLAGGDPATALVGTTTNPVTLPPGAPPVRVGFANLALLAAAHTSATVTAACTDSTGVTTDVEGAWYVTTGTLSAAWCAVPTGANAPTRIGDVTVELSWSVGGIPPAMGTWASCVAAIVLESVAVGLPWDTSLASALGTDVLSFSTATMSRAGACNDTAAPADAGCWVFTTGDLTLAAAPSNTSLAVVAECSWTPTGERVRLPPSPLFVPPTTLTWAPLTGTLLLLYLDTTLALQAVVHHTIPAAQWLTAAPSCGLMTVAAPGSTRLADAAALATYTVAAVDGRVTPDVVVGLAGDAGGNITVALECRLWDVTLQSPPLVLHATAVQVVPAAPLPTSYFPTDGATPLYLLPAIFRFIDDAGAPATPGTVCSLLSLTNNVELRMSAGTLVPDAHTGVLNITDARIVTTYSVASVTLQLRCSRPAGDAPSPLAWDLQPIPLAVSACSLPPQPILAPANGSLPAFSVAVGTPGWVPVGCGLPNNNSTVQVGGNAAAAAIAATAALYVVCSVGAVGQPTWHRSGVSGDRVPAFADVAAPPLPGSAMRAGADSDAASVATFGSLQLFGSSGAWYPLEITCRLGAVLVPGSVMVSARLQPCQDGTYPRSLMCATCPTDTLSLAGDVMCTSCPVLGATCTAGQLRLHPGYFRPPSDAGNPMDAAMQVFECYNGEACTLSNDINTATATYGCAPGYTGNLCGVCAAGYTKFSSKCRPCWTSAQGGAALGGIVSAAVSFLSFVGLRTGNSGSVAAWRPPLKMLLGFVQAVSALRAFKVGGTALFRSAMSWTDGASTSPLAAGGVACLLQLSMLAQLIAIVVLPLAGAVGRILIVAAVRGARQAQCNGYRLSCDATAWRHAMSNWMDQRRHVAACVFLLFLFYMPIVSACCRALSCYGRRIDGARWLMDDLSVQCFVGQHAVAVALAVLVLALFGVGFPAAILWTLARVPSHRLHDKHFIAAFGFLYLGYKRGGDRVARRSTVSKPSGSDGQCQVTEATDADVSTRRCSCCNRCVERFGTGLQTRVWWEGVVLLRKAGLVVLAMVVTEPFYQVVIAVILLATATVLQQRMLPYATNAFNNLETVMLATLYITAAASTLLLPTTVGATVSPLTAAFTDNISIAVLVLNLATTAALGSVVAWYAGSTVAAAVRSRATKQKMARRPSVVVPRLVANDEAATGCSLQAAATVTNDVAPTLAASNPSGVADDGPGCHEAAVESAPMGIDGHSLRDAAAVDGTVATVGTPSSAAGAVPAIRRRRVLQIAAASSVTVTDGMADSTHTAGGGEKAAVTSAFAAEAAIATRLSRRDSRTTVVADIHVLHVAAALAPLPARPRGDAGGDIGVWR